MHETDHARRGDQKTERVYKKKSAEGERGRRERGRRERGRGRGRRRRGKWRGEKKEEGPEMKWKLSIKEEVIVR